MPFGLVTAPSTFQGLMDKVLHRLHEISLSYLEDILIRSLTWEEHFKHLDILYNKLRKAGLRVKQKKSSFTNASCGYFGYIVGSGEIKLMEGTPRNVRILLKVC